jgi:hypothetical protein
MKAGSDVDRFLRRRKTSTTDLDHNVTLLAGRPSGFGFVSDVEV